MITFQIKDEQFVHVNEVAELLKTTPRTFNRRMKKLGYCPCYKTWYRGIDINNAFADEATKNITIVYQTRAICDSVRAMPQTTKNKIRPKLELLRKSAE